MTEKIFKINGIDICTESFGNPKNPAILLIMGATCSMVYWDEEFCEQLANSGAFVIRFDNRDVGAPSHMNLELLIIPLRIWLKMQLGYLMLIILIKRIYSGCL